VERYDNKRHTPARILIWNNILFSSFLNEENKTGIKINEFSLCEIRRFRMIRIFKTGFL
jgi:hypothetical protein